MISKVLERNLFHAGKTFIRAGEQNVRAHVIQKGSAMSYIEKDGEKIEINRYGPGTIIGEMSLILDTPLSVNYQALTDLTVISISRQDFEKKLAIADGTIKTILRHIVDKANTQEQETVQSVIETAYRDENAALLIQAIVSGLSHEKKIAYETAITPHINRLIGAIKAVKHRFKSEEDGDHETIDDDFDPIERTASILEEGFRLEELENENTQNAIDANTDQETDIPQGTMEEDTGKEQ